MFKRSVLVVLIGLAGLFAARASIVHAADGPLQGAWQVVDANGRPGPGLCIFAKTHYSMMTANAGVSDISGSLVTIRPVVAKIPVVMKSGAYEVYEFSIDGSTLSLTQRRNVRGPVEGRLPVTLVRVE